MKVKKQSNDSDRFMQWLGLDENDPNAYSGKHRKGWKGAKKYNKKHIRARRAKERRARKEGRK